MKVPVPYTEEEAFDIQERLDTKLDASHLSYRPAAQGTVAYLEGWKAFNLANEVFGFNGWSSEILSFTIDFADVDANGRISLGMSCMVRVHLKDGTYHDDIGYGSADNQKSKSAAYEKAKKEAVTDAMKRALRMFGNRLGNCAYDKVFLKEVKTMPVRPHGNNVPFRPANYPKLQRQQEENIPNENKIGNTANITAAVSGIKNSIPQVIQQAVESPCYDEMFDNSMMISEEDLIIHGEDSFGVMGLEEASFHATTTATTNVYPLLPNKRK